MFCMDDPYWKELFDRNYKRQHTWKLPSILAWKHKPHGMYGEVFDIPSLEKKYKEVQTML